MADEDVVDAEATAVQVYDRHTELFAGDLTAPMQAAEQLVSMVAQKCRGPKFISPIQGKNYPKVEWWTTVGAALGLFPREEDCHVIDDPLHPDCKAFEATVSVCRHGEIVARASAVCSTKERRWAKADTYAVRSMAITRATGKAYRLGLSFLAVMAGLEPTPAEEMPEPTRAAPPRQHQPAPTPTGGQPTSAAPPLPASPPSPAAAPPAGTTPPSPAAAHPVTTEGQRQTVTGTIDQIFQDDRNKEGQPFKNHAVKTTVLVDGQRYVTWSKTDASVAGESVDQHLAVTFEYTVSQWGNDIARDSMLLVDIAGVDTRCPAAVEEEQAAPQPAPQADPGVEEQLKATISGVDGPNDRVINGKQRQVWGIDTDQGRFGILEPALVEEAQANLNESVVIFYTATPKGNLAVRIEDVPF